MDRFPQHRVDGGRRLLPLGMAVAMLAVLALTPALGLASNSRAAVVPSNTSPPTISGTAQVGSTLTATDGSWNGTTPMTFSYQWRRCDENGGSCSSISGATDKTYTLKNVDSANTLRVIVAAKNNEGSASSTSVPSAVVTAAATPAPTPAPAANGCPKPAEAGTSVPVANVSAPARLQLDGFKPSNNTITSGLRSFTIGFHVSDTCGDPVQGANVYATAVPFNQVSIPPETATSNDGWVTLTFNRMAGFPLSSHQQLMAFFVRATKPGENPLAGISTRRLTSLRVNLHG
jgi:hypothetical protein